MYVNCVNEIMRFKIEGLECINKQIKIDFRYQQLSLFFNSFTIFQSNVPKIIYFRLFGKEIFKNGVKCELVIKSKLAK